MGGTEPENNLEQEICFNQNVSSGALWKVEGGEKGTENKNHAGWKKQ